MNNSSEKLMQQLLNTENQQIGRMNTIVAESLKEEKLLTLKLRHETFEKPSVGEKLSDKVASFGGSWKFILLFIGMVFIWIFINGQMLADKGFDPYPFILLNLALSLIATLQAPVILMSQNRQESKDRKRAEHDYLINLKAEVEIRALHQKIDLLLMEQVKALLQSQERQLEILEKLSETKENSHAL